jgi:hypothetical protein
MKSILDPTFRYVDSQHTDLRKAFARIRRDMKQQSSEGSRESPHLRLVDRRGCDDGHRASFVVPIGGLHSGCAGNH